MNSIVTYEQAEKIYKLLLDNSIKTMFAYDINAELCTVIDDDGVTVMRQIGADYLVRRSDIEKYFVCIPAPSIGEMQEFLNGQVDNFSVVPRKVGWRVSYGYKAIIRPTIIESLSTVLINIYTERALLLKAKAMVDSFLQIAGFTGINIQEQEKIINILFDFMMEQNTDIVQ